MPGEEHINSASKPKVRITAKDFASKMRDK